MPENKTTTLPATPLMRVDAAAAMLDVHPATIRRWIAAGRLPAVRLWRDLRVKRSDLEALLANGLSQAGERAA